MSLPGARGEPMGLWRGARGAGGRQLRPAAGDACSFRERALCKVGQRSKSSHIKRMEPHHAATPQRRGVDAAATGRPGPPRVARRARAGPRPAAPSPVAVDLARRLTLPRVPIPVPDRSHRSPSFRLPSHRTPRRTTAGGPVRAPPADGRPGLCRVLPLPLPPVQPGPHRAGERQGEQPPEPLADHGPVSPDHAVQLRPVSRTAGRLHAHGRVYLERTRAPTHRMPRSLSDTHREPSEAITVWSSTSMPSKAPAAASRRVKARSSALGSGSFEG